MSKLLAALTVLAALILFTPPPASAASKSDGARNAGKYEVSSQRYRRAYRRAVYVRPAYRPLRRAAWGPRWGYRRAAWAPGWGYRRAAWGPGWGYARPGGASYAYNPGWGGYYRPVGWGRPWGWGGYRSHAWGRPWGWGHRPGVSVSFGFGRGGWWW